MGLVDLIGIENFRIEFGLKFVKKNQKFGILVRVVVGLGFLKFEFFWEFWGFWERLEFWFFWEN